MLVLSIGILGLAGLQLGAKRAGYEALQRSTASFLAGDILERIRANPTALANYHDAEVNATNPATEPPACTANCVPAEIAARDLWEWKESLIGASEKDPNSVAVGGLVSPSGCILFSLVSLLSVCVGVAV